MIGALAVLLLCQLAGEVIARLTGLPVPGPVLGMLILFVGLAVKGDAPGWLRDTATGMLQHLSLLFVPAGVGVMLHLGRLQAEWPAILVALVVSTWLTIAVTAAVMRIATRAMGGPEPEESEE